MEQQGSLLQKLTNSLGITSSMIDLVIWLDTEDIYLEACAKRLNRALVFDGVFIPDVCRFTKRASSGKCRPGTNEKYYYGMRIRLPGNTDYNRVKNAIENCLWANTPKIKLPKVLLI